MVAWKSFTETRSQDNRVPIKGNRAVIAGKTRNVEAAVGICVGGDLARIEMRVLG